jgi:hypothetical protein
LAALVAELVGACHTRTGVATNKHETSWFIQWKRVVLIFQENDAGRSNLPNNLIVVILDINMFIDRIIIRPESVKID